MMHIGDEIGVAAVGVAFFGGLYLLSRKEKKSVSFSLDRGEIISGKLEIRGSYRYGQGYSTGAVQSIGTDVFGDAVESGLSCALLDADKKVIASFPAEVTGRTNDGGAWNRSGMAKAFFTVSVDASAMPKGPGYIRLGSGDQAHFGLALGADFPVTFA